MRHSENDSYDAIGSGVNGVRAANHYVSRFFEGGYNLEATRRELADFSPDMTSQNRLAQRVEANSATVATAGSDITKNAAPQQNEGGASSVLKVIGSGMWDELSNNKLGLVGTAALAVGVTAAAAFAPIPATILGVAAGLYGGYKLVTAIPGWAHDISVVSNSHQHSKEEVAKSEKSLHSLGAGTLDLAVGLGAGLTANALRTELAAATASLSSRAGTAFESVSTSASELGTKVMSSKTMFNVASKVADASTKASEVSTKVGDISGRVGDNVAAVATVLGAHGTRLANATSDKITSVASPWMRDASTAVLSVAEQGAATLDNVVARTATGLKNLGNSTVTVAESLAGKTADKGAQWAGKVLSQPYVEKGITLAAGLKERARVTTETIKEKAALSGIRFQENVAVQKMLASAERAIGNTDSLKSIGVMASKDGRFVEHIVQSADGKVFSVLPPAQPGGAFFASPRDPRIIDPQSIAMVKESYNYVWNDAPNALIPKNLKLAPEAEGFFRRNYRYDNGIQSA